MKKIINKVSLGLALGWMGLIYFFSSQTGEESSGLSSKIVKFIVELFGIKSTEDVISALSFIVRKGAHFTEYLILAVFVALFIFTLTREIKYRKSISVIICSLYAMSDEIHQGFVAYRSPQITDVLIDSAGAVLGVMIIAYCFYKKGKKDCK